MPVIRHTQTASGVEVRLLEGPGGIEVALFTDGGDSLYLSVEEANEVLSETLRRNLGMLPTSASNNVEG